MNFFQQYICPNFVRAVIITMFPYLDRSIEYAMHATALQSLWCMHVPSAPVLPKVDICAGVVGIATDPTNN